LLEWSLSDPVPGEEGDFDKVEEGIDERDEAEAIGNRPQEKQTSATRHGGQASES